jgi:disulfide bond formation protein DsbB
VVMLLGALHGPRGATARRVYGVLGMLTAGVGVYIAGRHVWMTHLPADRVPSCGAPLDFMVQMSGYFEAIRKVLTGSGECAKIDWTFLGLSMPAWSLAWLIALMLGALYIGFRRR